MKDSVQLFPDQIINNESFKKIWIMNFNSVIQKTLLEKITDRHVLFTTPLLVFSITFLYLFFYNNYLFFYQENISLFLFSGEYLSQYLIKPGGLLEYTGNFLAQFFYNPAYGALILSSVLTLIVITGIKINKQLSPGSSLSLIIILIPVCLLILMQLNFNWLLMNNIGFLLTMLYFSFSISSSKKLHYIITLTFFPIFYYLTGSFAWVFMGMYLVYCLTYKKGFLRFYYPGILLIIACISFILYKEFVFLQPATVLLLFPFSLRDNFTHPVIIFLIIGFFILIPLLEKILSNLKIKSKYSGIISLSSVLITLIITIVVLSNLYDPNLRKLFKLEKLVYMQDWKEVIKYQEDYQIGNIVAQFYYDLALSEEDQLCDRMFCGRQDYGTKALIIPWDSQAGVNNISRGVYFYYAIGLINEAHRWAYESMVAQGYRPENIKLLVKTELINGHYKLAEKYIDILQKTMHYRDWAKKYKAMLNRPDLVQSDPELGEKMSLLTGKDFSISIKNPQTNLPLLLDGNTGNRKAFEYLMAWFLLEKNIQGVVNEIGKIKNISYSRLPRHLEEALIIYNISTGMMPDIGTLKISQDAIDRYRQYEILINPYSRTVPTANKEFLKEARNTYWFYFEFR
jgi:hypothetical protein